MAKVARPRAREGGRRDIYFKARSSAPAPPRRRCPLGAKAVRGLGRELYLPCAPCVSCADRVSLPRSVWSCVCGREGPLNVNVNVLGIPNSTAPTRVKGL